MKVQITREIRILLLTALRREYFTEEEAIRLYNEIYVSSDLISLKRLGEIVNVCGEVNENIKQENNAESV